MTYDPGACDTFTTMPPPPSADVDAVLAGMLRKAWLGNRAEMLCVFDGGRYYLSVSNLPITKQEYNTLRLETRHP